MVEEVRAAIRQYDAALRRSDVAALERFWAQEYSLVNPRGERLTREDRLAGSPRSSGPDPGGSPIR
jgi:ketosteroid isomerase-like protein